jgi:AAA+ superfamily predicted ATPase
MKTSRQELEAHLAEEPFDTDARYAYASQLEADQDIELALKQYLLLVKQAGGARARIGEARSLLALGRAQEARAAYARARLESDFTDDPGLAEKLGAAANSVQLRSIDGGGGQAAAPVIAMSSLRPTRFVDVVGMDALKKTLRVRILEPFLQPALFARFSKKVGGGILLYGPPGCGKTLIARALAGECNATFIPVSISEILTMWIGESERNLAALFDKARSSKPSVLFFDELDALAYSRAKSSSEHTRRLVDEFLQQLDGFSAVNDQVLVLGATNMPWDVDSAMKRPGRFDRQVFVPPPDAEARQLMFEHKLATVPTEGIDHASLAARTEHFSGADIDGIIELAKEQVLSDILDGARERPLRPADLAIALQAVQPSTLDWLRTARNIVKFGGDAMYRDVETYLKAHRMA